MRNGFTTGSCAAAAGKAAAYMLLGGNRISSITIDTPAGVRYTPAVENITIEEKTVSCAVRKDAGDDPDLTDGALICAAVSILSYDLPAKRIEKNDPSEEGTGGNGLIEKRIDGTDLTGEGTASAGLPGKGAYVDGFKGKETDRIGLAGECAVRFNPQEGRVMIKGGRGVGRVTRPGLDQPVGSAAINSVPRQMIGKEVGEVMDFFDFRGSLLVEISVPAGEELAQRTFNPRLGIEGGISILGTTGVVEPMSTRALLETIRAELSQVRAMGASAAVISPGNYGLDFMKETYGYDLEKAVKCSNYIGETIDMAADLGFSQLLLCGHVGKLIKVSGGIMNTHSKEADCRMELMAAAAARCGAPVGTLGKILDSISTEEACAYLLEERIMEPCFGYIMERIEYYLNKRAGGRLQTHCIVYSNKYGLLGATDMAERFLHDRVRNSFV